MADYSQLKVPELKKLLADRGLHVTGNKADLIARLQENDKAQERKKAEAAAGTSIPSYTTLSVCVSQIPLASSNLRPPRPNSAAAR
jgi:SAP domain-containing ribonucleoprotein